MGMYHYVYNRRLNVDMYLDKTSRVESKVNPYYREFSYRGGARLGVVLQSLLRRKGYVDRVKPVEYPYFGKKRWFLGHTYVDTSAIPLLQAFWKEYPHYWVETLIHLLQAYPGRWYIYGDDMCEPRPWVDRNRRSTRVRDAKFTKGKLVLQ